MTPSSHFRRSCVSSYVKFVLCGPDFVEHKVKLGRSDSLRVVFEDFCQTRGRTLNEGRFLFNGQRIDAFTTPDAIGLKNGSIIDFVC